MLIEATKYQRVRRQLNNVLQYQTHTGDPMLQHEMEMNQYKVMKEKIIHGLVRTEIDF